MAGDFKIDSVAMPKPSRFVSVAPPGQTVTVINGGTQVSQRAKGWKFQLHYGSGSVADPAAVAALITLRNSLVTHAFSFVGVNNVTYNFTVQWVKPVEHSLRGGQNQERFTIELVEAP